MSQSTKGYTQLQLQIRHFKGWKLLKTEEV